jgi:hypothetical protein
MEGYQTSKLRYPFVQALLTVNGGFRQRMDCDISKTTKAVLLQRVVIPRSDLCCGISATLCLPTVIHSFGPNCYHS